MQLQQYFTLKTEIQTSLMFFPFKIATLQEQVLPIRKGTGTLIHPQ